MAPVVPNPKRIRAFRSAAAFDAWLDAKHVRETEIWLRIYKKGSGKPTVTLAEALDVALCWGWIDGIRKAYDAESFLQRYTPRRARSVWSQINRGHVGRLIASGRMKPAGQRQVDAAKQDGRWDAAYPPIRAAAKPQAPAMDDLMRFPSAVKHDPAIDAWIGAQRDDLRPFVQTWFARMRRCGADVRELMHDGCPTACVQDAAFGYVGAFTAHVNVGFFRGALLTDPARLLEGTGKRGRHVKLRPGRTVDRAALAALVDAAYADAKVQLRRSASARM
jgi:uncharacterized protein YdeI (YjbR/CyaY-like superfamily)